MQRPLLDTSISITDFNDYYWRKEELIIFCRSVGIPTTGNKATLTQYVQHYLQTKQLPVIAHSKVKCLSRFDWQREILNECTVITDNYTNTENVRAFFEKALGPTFTFKVAFMNWMKNNVGCTLGDAILEWKRLRSQSKKPAHITEIGKQFEYNRYIRAIMKDNPQISRPQAIKFWKIKSSLRGDTTYDRKDVDLQ